LPHANCGDIAGYLLTDSQEIDAVLDTIGCNLLDITGAIVVIHHGDYETIWLTQSSRPYDVNSEYFKIRG
jgi:hypothetical protein